MRQLTLDEKISIKGLMARKREYGFNVNFTFPLALLNMDKALFLFPRMFGKSIADYYKITKKRGLK